MLLLAAVGEAVLYGGGFDTAPQLIFSGLAILALATASKLATRSPAQAAREPVVAALWVLGALGAASALWTVGSATAALGWGLLTAAYGAAIVAAATVASHRHGTELITVALVALALIGAVLGICDATAFTGPFATDTTGYWRPAGTFGYSAALGLLEVSALPALMRAMVVGNRHLATGAAFAGAVAAVALALGHSRLECGFAVLVCVAALQWPRRTLKATRRDAAGVCLLLLACALGAYAIAGAHVSLTAHPHEPARLGGIACICVAAALAWAIGRERSRPLRQRAGWIAGIAVITLGLVALAAVTGDVSHTNYSQSAGFFHGRLGLWGSAVRTSSHRLLIGHGADSDLVLVAGAPSRDTMDYAQSLPLELVVELGAGGALLALALYLTGLRAVWQRLGADRAWIFAPAAVCFLLANLLDWEWHLAGSGAVWALTLGALLASPPAPPRVLGGPPRGAPLRVRGGAWAARLGRRALSYGRPAPAPPHGVRARRQPRAAPGPVRTPRC